jgi:polyhydroxyalkanoate synthase
MDAPVAPQPEDAPPPDHHPPSTGHRKPALPVRRDAAPAAAAPADAPLPSTHDVAAVALVVDELAPPLALDRRQQHPQDRRQDDRQDDLQDDLQDHGADRGAQAPAAPEPSSPRDAALAPSSAGSRSSGAAAPGAYPPYLDVDALTANLTQLMTEASRAFAASLTPRDGQRGVSGSVGDAVATLGQIAEYWYADPQRTLEMQARLGSDFLALFTSMSKRLAGEPAEPAAMPDRRDTRFSDPEWSSNQYFDFIKQAYLILAHRGAWLIDHADAVDPVVRRRAEFYMRQIADALAPSNFLFTNPELLRTTLNRSADNLARGAAMLAEDIEAGGGDLKIRQSDPASFRVGGNLATTPGKVVHQNDLMQLIQYTPATTHVLRRPLLIVPPWINKYYVLDLTPENSFIRWCVAHGLTVFVISWVNPDGRHAGKDFADYMREGPLEALDVIADITREDRVAALGYCVGGTLLAFTLAAMAARGDARITAATLL